MSQSVELETKWYSQETSDMAVDRMHIMSSNMRLINQIEKDLFSDAEKVWSKVYAQFCKRQAELTPERIMQFKYKGELYKLNEDVALRGGVKPLHKDLLPEFEEAYKMFVTELDEEKYILKNMISHAIRIAKYAEDLLELLPPIMHPSIEEAGFFQHESKPLMSVQQEKEFKSMYSKYFDIFDTRKTIGALM